MSAHAHARVSEGGARSSLGRLNPVAKIAITVVITIGLLLTLDPVEVGGILVLELAAIPFVGVGIRAVASRVGLLLGIAIMLLLVNALFSGKTTGIAAASWGPFSLSTDGLLAATPIGMRVLALSLPAALLLAPTDPLQMADAVQRHLRVPARYALAMVVGLRLLPLLTYQWQELSAARRARGLTATGPVSAIRAAWGRTLGLLVEALRRAVRMAAAMQARGFDPYAPRTCARESPLSASDVVVPAAVALLVIGSGLYARLR